MSNSTSKVHVQKTFLKIMNANSGHCKLLTGRGLGQLTAAPHKPRGFCLLSGSLALTCAWPSPCRMSPCHTCMSSTVTSLWHRDLDATFSGEPGLCQGNIRMVGLHGLFLKTAFVLLKVLEAVFMLLRAQSIRVEMGHTLLQDKGKAPDWRYGNSCLPQPPTSGGVCSLLRH